MSGSVRWCFLVLALAVMVIGQQPRRNTLGGTGNKVGLHPHEDIGLADDAIQKDRMTRQSRPKPTPQPLGFFGTIKQLIFDQYNDTKSAMSQLSTMFDNQFSDTPLPSTPEPVITDNSTTTTTPPPRISRKEFLRILGRNIKGLRRLYNLEYREAMADSRKNIQEYKREFNRKLYDQFKD